MFFWRRALIRDAIIIFGAWAGVSLVLAENDFFEWLFEQTRNYEHFELDEIVVAIFALGFFALLAALRVTLALKSQRQAFDAAIIQEQSYRQALVDHVPSAMALKDLDGRCLLINKCFEELIGLPKEQVVGQNPHKLNPFVFTRSDAEKTKKVFETKRAIHWEEQQGTGANARYFAITKFPIFSENSEITSIGSVRVDITDLKLRELEVAAARIQAEAASSAKNLFLANMSHEVRTPLNAVVGLSEVIANGLPQDSAYKDHKEHARQIHLSGRHLLEMINDVLDMTRLEAGRMEPNYAVADLSNVAKEAISLVAARAKSRKIDIDLEIGDYLDAVPLDAIMMRQVLTNLLSNAIKFSAEYTTACIRAERHDDNSVEICVIDKGIGIKSEDLQTAFTPFEQIENIFSRSNEGVGLGLPLAVKLVEAHQGSLSIDSTPGEGTTVRIKLPQTAMTQRAAS